MKDLQKTLKSKTKFHQIVFDSKPNHESSTKLSSNDVSERNSADQSDRDVSQRPSINVNIPVCNLRAPSNGLNGTVQSEPCLLEKLVVEDESCSSSQEDFTRMQSSPPLKFDSDFESGNLRCAVRVGWF